MYKQSVVSRQSNSLVIPQKAWLGLWLIVFVLVFAWRAQNLDAFGLSNDEGAHLMWARLAADGYPLYSETQAVQAPLFIESIGWAFRIAGQNIQAGRWVILISFGLLTIALSWLAHRAGSWPASLMALVLAGISPLIFTFSRLVMGEAPATALAVVSAALLILYLENGHKGWLFASGLALGLSFIVKALNLFVVAPVGVLLLFHHTQRQAGGRQTAGVMAQLALPGKDWRALIYDSLLWGVGVCLPLIAVLLIYEPAAVYDQLVAFRGDLRAAIPGSWPNTWQHFRAFINSHWGFWLLAFGGIISTVLRVYAVESGELGELNSTNSSTALNSQNSYILYNLAWGVWLIAGVAMLAWHTPLFPHHFIVLAPPLILLAAGLVANLVVLWPRAGKNGLVSYSAVAFLLLVVIGAAFNAPSMVKANQSTAAIVTGGREQEALQLLKAVSNPDDFVMGDSQLLIFMANRRAPPPLGDVALVAIKAGRQTSARMIGLTQEYRAPAVVQWSLRLPWLPEYLAWVEASYLARRVWDNDHIIYFGPRIADERAIPNQRFARLGGSLALRGFEFDSDSIAPGRDLNLKLYWQTDAPLANDYTIFTQLLDSNGALAAGQDSQPLGGYFPTSRWPVDEIVTDVVHLPLPAGLPPGDYTLITGMYLLETLERLPVSDGGGDHVVLTTIKIE